MGDSQAPPTQLDIDSLAAHAGLIINIKAGDILVNTAGNSQQNLSVSHSDDLYLDPCETKTLNGIYAACIDHYRLSPDPAIAFAVTPPLESWNGINAVQPYLRLIQYIDSLGLYCNYYDDYFAQEAIWRITDNAPLFDSTADSLLINAGINQ